MKIRRATLKDVGGCLELQKSYGEKFWKKDNFVKAVKDKDAIFLAAEEGGKIVGCVLGFVNLVKRDEAFLQETRTHKKEERKGIGKKLVEGFCKAAKKKGVKEIYSEIEREHIPFYIRACKFKDRGKHVLILKGLK
ncbi:MAG: GNAT family N-acetyltransferase [Nanoarchaeota archaeon]